MKIFQFQKQSLDISPQQILHRLPAVFCVLGLVFTVLLSCRTNTILKKIQPQHLLNLPSKNVLTLLDTQILFVSIIIQFFVISVIHILFHFLLISHDQFVIQKAILHLIIDNLFICFVFPSISTMENLLTEPNDTAITKCN